MTAFSQVCDPVLFDHIDPENRTNCDHCSEYLKYMIGKMENTFYDCYQYKEDICEDIFEEVMTERGVCYTFNGLKVYRTNNLDSDISKDNWTLDNGYTYDDDFITPRPATDQMLIMFLIAIDYMSDGLCKGPIKGFNVYLHLPNEAPQISKHYYLVPFEQTVQINIIPKMIKTAPELRDFSIDKRQCYFNDERYLRFFRYYTQNNCEVECLANLTVSKCGCQRFYMPSECFLKGSADCFMGLLIIPEIRGVKYCGISDIKCYQSVIQQSVEHNANQNSSTDCNCLPACTTITFDAEINQISILTGRDFIPKDDEVYFWGKR
jgi:acid-sensing ion channel, other